MRFSPAMSPRGDVPVDRDLHEIRLRELEQTVGQERHERQRDERFVRAEIAQQPPHQPGVVRLPQDVFFVERHRQDAASSSSSSCFL